MTDYQYLKTRREDATLLCEINNPPQNFLNATIVAELSRLADEVDADESIRALVITGAVEGIFVTHYDVTELSGASDVAQRNESFGSGELHGMHQVLLKLQRLRAPVIAAINGTAMGGGCELTLACDFRLMARGAWQIGLPEVRVGILPGAGGTQRMTRLIGVARAMELITLGKTLDADVAANVGLIHRAVEPDQLMPEALALAAELASRPAEAVALIKQCILQGSEMPLEDGLRLEQESFWTLMRSPEAARLMREYLGGGRPLNES
jgi:enoyl-CoA hydratase